MTSAGINVNSRRGHDSPTTGPPASTVLQPLDTSDPIQISTTSTDAEEKYP
jgi:hypothetical protein